MDDDERAVFGPLPIGRPRVADGDRGVLRRFADDGAREIVEAVGGACRGRGIGDALKPDAALGFERLGEFAIHMRQASVIEERADPVHSDVRRLRRVLGGKERAQAGFEIRPMAVEPGAFRCRKRWVLCSLRFRDGFGCGSDLPVECAELEDEIEERGARAEFGIECESFGEGLATDQ